MKKRLFQIFGVAAIAGLGLTSCEVDNCADVECGTNGTCVDGDCVCDAGYEGTACDTEERAEFIATYNVSESCTSGNYTYTISIQNSTQAVTSVIVSNFGDYGVNLTGTVNSNNVTFANQTVDGLTFSASGQLSGNILTITYNVSDGQAQDDCVMTCTKQ